MFYFQGLPIPSLGIRIFLDLRNPRSPTGPEVLAHGFLQQMRPLPRRHHWHSLADEKKKEHGAVAQQLPKMEHEE